MKFTVHKSDLVSTLTKIQGITSSKRSNLAITACILIRAESDSITIKATDLETAYFGLFPALVEIEGEVAISSKKLLEIIREFPEEHICLHETENRWIRIFGGKTEFNIMGMASSDFPQLPDISQANLFEIESQSIKKAIEKITIIPPGPSDDRRSYVHGVFFEHVETEQGTVIRFLSTDAKRLFLCDAFTPRVLPKWESSIIPKKGLSETLKFIDEEPVIQLAMHGNNFIVKKPAECLTISLLEGDFPEYEDLMSPPTDEIIAFDIHPLMMTLRRMSILTSEAYRTVVFDFRNDILTISASNPEMGQSMESLPLDFNREPIEVAFNPRFFMDALECIDGDRALMYIADKETPCLLEGVESKDFKAVVMPVKF